MLKAVILGLDEWRRMKNLAAAKDAEGIGKFLLDILPPGILLTDVELTWRQVKGRVWVEITDRKGQAA